MNELWDEEDGFFYDRLRKPDGETIVVRARSMVGLLPVFASVQLPTALWESLPNFSERAGWFIDNMPQLTAFVRYFTRGGRTELICLVDKPRLKRVLARMFDENEFLSPYGLRSLSRFHRDHPLVIDLGGTETRLDYEPAESTTPLFGGNSNWRGPVWFPLNLLAVESLRALHQVLGDDFTIELPTGSGKRADLGAAADEIERRLHQALRQGRRRPQARRWSEPPVQARLRVDRAPALLRIFQRRHRRRPRRLASDRMDRARRLPDRAPRKGKLSARNARDERPFPACKRLISWAFPPPSARFPANYVDRRPHDVHYVF